MVHLPKLAFPHGAVIPPRLIPLWFPVTLAMIALALTAAAVQVTAGHLNFTGNDPGPPPALETYIMKFVNDWSAERDPLITLPSGVQAKASNVYGIEYGGMRYYYQLTRQSSFDPLRRGAIRDYEVVQVIDPGTPWEVLIYREK